MSASWWQDLVVALLAALALGWLVWRRLRRPRRASPLCDGCAGCRAAEACAHPDGRVTPRVIPLDDLTRSPRKPRP